MKLISVSRANYPTIYIKDPGEEGKIFYNTAAPCIYNRPTGNCQVASIAKFDTILRFTDPRAALMSIWPTSGKSLCLIDVSQNVGEQVEKLIDKVNILTKSSYTSTYHSNIMVIYIINLRNQIKIWEIQAIKPAEVKSVSV